MNLYAFTVEFHGINKDWTEVIHIVSNNLLQAENLLERQKHLGIPHNIVNIGISAKELIIQGVDKEGEYPEFYTMQVNPSTSLLPCIVRNKTIPNNEVHIYNGKGEITIFRFERTRKDD